MTMADALPITPREVAEITVAIADVYQQLEAHRTSQRLGKALARLFLDLGMSKGDVDWFIAAHEREVGVVSLAHELAAALEEPT